MTCNYHKMTDRQAYFTEKGPFLGGPCTDQPIFLTTSWASHTVILMPLVALI